MNKSNISENDSRDYYLNQLVSKCGFQQITISKDEIYNKFIYKPSFNKYLKNRYPNITDDEINKIIKTIESDLSIDNWLINNKIGINYLRTSIHIKNENNESKNYNLYDEQKINDNIWEIAKEVLIGFQSRLDLVILLNGLPIYVFELKSMVNRATIQNAVDQINRYARGNAKFFTFNTACIAMTTEMMAKVGAPNIDLEHWFKIEEVQGDELTKIKRIEKTFYHFFNYSSINNYIKNGVLFEKGNNPKKIILKHHQLRASIKVMEVLKEKKGGLIYHAPGSGKTITISSIVANALNKSGIGSTTFIIDVDRKDLISNIFRQFASLDQVTLDTKIKKIESRNELKEILKNVESRGVYMTTTQKFSHNELISNRSDIVILTDEAHRTHKDSDTSIIKKDSNDIKNDWNDVVLKQITSYFDKMKTSFPNATLIGFTGSPIMKKDLETTNKFGEYIDIYNMKEAEEDEVITKINFNWFQIKFSNINHDPALESLNNKKTNINDHAKIIDLHPERLNLVADEIVAKFKKAEYDHYLTPENRTNDVFKAMIAANSIDHGWALLKKLQERKITDNDEQIKLIASDSHLHSPKDVEVAKYLRSHNETQIIDKFRYPNNSEYKILIVVNKCLTGYDVQNLRMLFIDKDLKEHNLFQAIMRVNRVFKNKKRGIVVCFRPLTSELKDALKMYRENSKDDSPIIDSYANFAAIVIDNIKKFEKHYVVPVVDNELVVWINNTVREIYLMNEVEKKEVLSILDDIYSAKDLADFKKEEEIWKTKLEYLKILIVAYWKLQKEDRAVLKLTEEQIALIHKNSYIDIENCFYVINDLELDKLIDNPHINNVSVFIKPIKDKLIKKIRKNKILTDQEKNDFIDRIISIYNKWNKRVENEKQLIQQIVGIQQEITNLDRNLDDYTKILMKTFKEQLGNSYKFDDLGWKTINEFFIENKDKLERDIKSNSNRVQTRLKFNISNVIKENNKSLTNQKLINNIINNFFQLLSEDY